MDVKMGSMDGKGVARDAFEVLQKGIRDGHVASFVIDCKYTKEYQKVLECNGAPAETLGVTGMFCNSIEGSLHVINLLENLLSKHDQNGATALLGAIMHGLKLKVGNKVRFDVMGI